jgi:hypothetical protein
MNVPQIIIIIVLSISVITDILVMHRSRREKDICYKIPFFPPSTASIDNNPRPGPPNTKLLTPVLKTLMLMTLKHHHYLILILILLLQLIITTALMGDNGPPIDNSGCKTSTNLLSLSPDGTTNNTLGDNSGGNRVITT